MKGTEMCPKVRARNGSGRPSAGAAARLTVASLEPLERRRMAGGCQAATGRHGQSRGGPGCPPPTAIRPHLHPGSRAGDGRQSQEARPQEG